MKFKSLEYGKVTSSYKDDAYGAQLCDVKSQISDREFVHCEVLAPKGVNTLPRVGDTVLVAEIHNSEMIVMGVLETKDLDLEEGEVLIWNFEHADLSIKFNKDKEIVVKTPVKVRIEAPLVEIV